MELNQILLWIVGLSCAAILLRGAQLIAGGAMGWLIICIFILAVMGITWLFHPEYAGLIGGGLWLVLILLPALAATWSRRLIERQRFDTAAMVAGWVRLLHPFDGYWHSPRLLRAQFLVEQGEIEEALKLYDTLRHRPGLIGHAANSGALRARRQWAELTHWVENDLPKITLQRDVTLFVAYLRALGETGQVEQMLKVFAVQPRLLHQPALASARNMARLFVFAFSGEPHRAESVLYGGALSAIPDGIKQFWIATAEQTAGNFPAATERLDRLLLTASKSLRDAAIDRKLRPLAANLMASDELSRQQIEQADRDHRHELLYVRAAPGSRRLPVITLILIFLNVIAFGVEVARGGATNWVVLYQMGAAQSVSIRAGEWWRLLSANFLHLGWVHLFMNMLGLLALGPFVERSFGRIRYTVLYLLSGIIGIGFVIVRSWQGANQFEILVGASAAVMGLVGATGAILLCGWLRDRARSAARRLRGVGFIVAFQIFFDSQNPQVSGKAHLAGCAAGFLLALPYCVLSRRKRAVTSQAGVLKTAV